MGEEDTLLIVRPAMDPLDSHNLEACVEGVAK